jgi:hypothetical protein
MKELITTTFTVESEPNYLELSEHFQHIQGFFDLEVEKYNDGQELWTVSITYPVSFAEIYCKKLKQFNALSFFDNWIKTEKQE